MTIRPERLFERCIKHPVPSSTGPFAKSYSIDAGTVHQLLDSNSGHLCEESVRHLVTDVSTGVISIFQSGGEAWVALEDASDPYTALNGPSLSTWDRRIGRRYGPFVLCGDAGSTPTEPKSRKVRLSVVTDRTGSFSTCTLLVAMTRAPDASEITGGLSLGFSSTAIAAGLNTYDFTFAERESATLAGRDSMQAASVGYATELRYQAFWLWVSVVTVGSGTVNIASVSAWEGR